MGSHPAKLLIDHCNAHEEKLDTTIVVTIAKTDREIMSTTKLSTVSKNHISKIF
jgi:hypothetical protein